MSLYGHYYYYYYYYYIIPRSKFLPKTDSNSFKMKVDSYFSLFSEGELNESNLVVVTTFLKTSVVDNRELNRQDSIKVCLV